MGRHQAELWSFLLSFVVISRLWFSQHRVVRAVNLFDEPVVSLFVGWTLTIAFLPFPTALVAKAGQQPATKVLYVGTIALSVAIVAVLVRVVVAKPRIRTGPPLDPMPGIVAFTLLAVALVAMLAWPATSYPLLLLLMEGPSRRLAARLRQDRRSQRRMGE